MTFTRILTTTSAMALLAGPAMADLTAEQVWTDWRDLLASYGAEITTTSEDQSGGTLTVSGLTTAFTVQDGSMSLNLGDISFTEQGDGSVVVTMQESLPFSMEVTDPDGKDGTIGFTINQPGALLVASGDTDNLRYHFDYPTMTMTDLVIEGDDVPEDLPVEFEMTLTGMTGWTTLTDGDLRSFGSEVSVASMNMDMAFDDPEEGTGGMKFSISDLNQTSSGSIGSLTMDMSAVQMIEAGLRQVAKGSYGPSTFEFTFDGPDGAMAFAGAAESGELDMTFDEAGLNYGGVTRGMTMTVGGSVIPFPPLTFKMAESAGRLAIPLVPSEEAQDFTLLSTIVGLEIDDMLWSMFDPTQQLPRDPATLVVDLGGSVVLSEDFTDPEYAENPDAPPGTIEAVSINEIRLKLAGAELTGDGDFTFNNDMGMPVPSGTANMMLTGGNTLLDTLVAMGLVPEDQAMGARMMLGLFARPGDGEDTLVSTIEVNEDGSVLANGQRIK